MDEKLKEYLVTMLPELVATGDEMLAEDSDPGIWLEVENAREALEKLKLEEVQ